MLAQLYRTRAPARLSKNESIISALRSGQAPLAEHEAMFDFVSQISRDVCEGIASDIGKSIDRGEIDAVFDAVSAVLAHQALLAPYYFALFHQNQERHLLSRITGRHGGIWPNKLRVGVFTDSFNDISASGRFAEVLAQIADGRGLEFIVHTCGDGDLENSAARRNFRPLLSREISSGGFELKIPPVLEILESSDRHQFDVVIANTAGPMGCCAWLVSKMLRVPMLAIMHDDLPAHVFHRTSGDYRLSAAAKFFCDAFYASAEKILTRSRAGGEAARRAGISSDKLLTLPPAPLAGPPDEQPDRQAYWEQQRVHEPIRIVCSTQDGSAREIALINETFKLLQRQRPDVALVMFGDRPHLADPAVYQLHLKAGEIDRLLASADLLLCPARDDINGQLVLDAQALGLPVVVNQHAAAREMMDDGLSGVVVADQSAAAWTNAILDILADEPRRQRMSRTAAVRAQRYCRQRTFDVFWDACLETCGASRQKNQADQTPSPQEATVLTPEMIP